MIDLHVHSTFSDGSLTPKELVEKARGFGLKAIALTDHDTTAGVDQFLAACNDGGRPILGIPGVEISADVHRGTMHILGYFIDRRNERLEGALVRIREGRESRNSEILAKLNGLGMELAWDEVAACAGEDVVGRPHFAQAMMKRGYVKTHEEAFDRYLKRGKPGYAERFRFSPEESIAAIRGAGGVAIVSHPFTLELDSSALRKYVLELKDVGLQGIEVYYSEHNPAQVNEYLTLARELGLIATGGSDFHGGINPDIKMGIGFGNLRVPDEIADELRRASSGNGV